MRDYKGILTTNIAEELGLKKGKNSNWHCFNKAAHNNEDKKASLSIAKDGKGFTCFGCGLQGNNIELVKQVLNLDGAEAMRWLDERFWSEDKHLDPRLKKKPDKMQLRFISSDVQNRFRFYPLHELDLREPTDTDLKAIKEKLNKTYSLKTLQKARIKINHSKAGYALAFLKGRLIYNPAKHRKFIHVEGRTDYLTAIEMGLDDSYGIVSHYNKTVKIRLGKGTHIFLLDKDLTEQGVFERIEGKEKHKLKLIRLPKKYVDLSDYFNQSNLTKPDIEVLIDAAKFVESKATNEPLPRKFPIYSGHDLVTLDFPEPQWAIDKLVPEGLTILAGRPKSGKSFMALSWSLAIASGGKALSDYSAREGEVLYLGLEDTPRRLADRIKTMLRFDPGVKGLESFHFMPDFNQLEDGGDLQLRNCLDQKKDIRMVVIDTFGRFANPKRNSDLYSEDYKTTASLQKIAMEYHLAIVLIHHTRKTRSDYALDDVTGTTGVTAAADCVMVLVPGATDSVLHITGRDMESLKLSVTFDKTTGLWVSQGEAEDVELSEPRKKILETVSNSDKPLSPTEIAEQTGKSKGSIKKLVTQMYAEGQLTREARGQYTANSNQGNFDL
ncbi:MAG: AAA family ATPase [Calditrichia bacterium]